MEKREEIKWRSWIRIPTKHPEIAIEAARIVHGANFVRAEIIRPDPKKLPGFPPDVIVYTNTPVPTTEEAQENAIDLLLRTMDELQEKDPPQ